MRRRTVIGVDIGTESVRAAVFDVRSGHVLGSAVVEHGTQYPAPGHVEQSPDEWWENVGRAFKAALPAGVQVDAVCFATTSCTVVTATADGQAIGPAIMWSDARAKEEAARLGCSAEWMLPKALWLEHKGGRQFDVLCECGDFINFKCTGRWVANACSVATRWHGDGRPGVPWRPHKLLEDIGLEDIKWPRQCVPMGTSLGRLTKEAAAHLGLTERCEVVQGGADAFVALMVAEGEGSLVVTGSSHLHLVTSAADQHAGGGAAAPSSTADGRYWGPHRGAPLPHLCLAEGGQSSTGSALRFMQRNVFGGTASLATLDGEAASLPVGAQGLVALETFQGSRTPVTDPGATGALTGLTLFHTRAHIWRAVLEAICLGTKASLDALAEFAEFSVVRMCGGAVNSRFFAQMHADAANKTVVYNPDMSSAPVCGAAVLAIARCRGVSLRRAARIVVGQGSVVLHPDPGRAREYAALYKKYAKVAASLRGGATDAATSEPDGRYARVAASKLRGGATDVAASILDCDDALADARRARDAGCWIHVDVCDGSAVCDGAVSSTTPIADLRRELGPDAVIDVHLAVDDPVAWIPKLDGATRVTVQLEAVEPHRLGEVLASAAGRGFKVGIAVAPATPLTRLLDALDRHPVVDLVDVLAVEPGRGGQRFQPAVLAKVVGLGRRVPHVQVDGGINADSAPLAVRAGATVLVAGTFLFKEHRTSFKAAVRHLQSLDAGDH